MLMIASEYAPEATRGEVAWQEMVWRQAFVSMLAVENYTIDDAAKMADEALVEWKKRWQR